MHDVNRSRRAPAIFLGLVLSLNVPFAVPVHAADARPSGDLVVVVSPRNPVTGLTRNQVADIFLGRSVQFPDGSRAVPLDQPESSPVRSAFNDRVLGRSAAQIRAHWAKIIFTGRGRPPQDVSGCAEVKNAIAEDPRAIGYIERSSVDASVVVVTIE
jgi:ABC-type phosphate transport system substrate-binding protein